VTKWLMGTGLVLAVAAAGCGNGGTGAGGTGGGGEERLTKAAFISQADAICATAHTKEQAIDFPSVDPQSATDDQMNQLAEALDKAVDVDRQEIDDLRKLNAPADFADGFDESMNELSEGLDHAEKAADAARDGKKEEITKELAAVEAKANEANDRAKAYGLKICGGTS
jgi:hypothetical protein